MGPDFFGGEAEDGRHQPHQRIFQAVERGLRAATRVRLSGCGVQPVFQHVEIERTEIHRGEIVERPVDLVEREFVIPGAAVGHQRFGADQDPLVEFQHFVHGHRIRRRIEAGKVAQEVAEGIAQLAVGVLQPRQDGLRDAHIFVELHRSRPQPDEIGAMMLDDLIGLDGVAERFVHGVALAIQHPAVQRTGAVWRTALESHAHQQRAMEPAAILIAAFHVKIRGPRQIVGRGEHGQMARSGIEPDVQDIGFLAELRAAALGAGYAGRQQFGRGALVPDVGGVLGKELHDAVQDFAVGERFAAMVAVEDDDGHAPHTLARNAPIRARGDHVGDALLAPFGHPAHLADGFERVLPEIVAVHADEPLLGGAEDGRLVAAPAMRIAVFDLFRGQQGAMRA